MVDNSERTNKLPVNIFERIEFVLSTGVWFVASRCDFSPIVPMIACLFRACVPCRCILVVASTGDRVLAVC